MNVRSIQPGHPVSPAEVWSGLTVECQTHVIQLLARLASNLADFQPVPTPRRPTDDDTPRRPEDPA
ncbi:MAG TPA: hypothetical protein VKP69_11625 [Isosphaeraceae bacterium]|jgi:hypothetical protein|nr:hypothetical protein [Isosphaeraceae bacterium]